MCTINGMTFRAPSCTLSFERPKSLDMAYKAKNPTVEKYNVPSAKYGNVYAGTMRKLFHLIGIVDLLQQI